MLDNDPVVDSLLAYNPFKGSERPPRFVRALHYEYKFTRAGDPDARAGRWWTRRYRGQYLPPVDKGILRDAYTKFGWKWKKLKTKN